MKPKKIMSDGLPSVKTILPRVSVTEKKKKTKKENNVFLLLIVFVNFNECCK